MQLQIETTKEIVFGFLTGELDHHSAKNIRTELDETIVLRQPQKLILDFSGITFMDSSGIGLLMGRYKLLKSQNATLEVYGLSSHIYKVMHLAGLEQLVTLEKKGLPKKYREELTKQEERREAQKIETFA